MYGTVVLIRSHGSRAVYGEPVICKTPSWHSKLQLHTGSPLESPYRGAQLYGHIGTTTRRKEDRLHAITGVMQFLWTPTRVPTKKSRECQTLMPKFDAKICPQRPAEPPSQDCLDAGLLSVCLFLPDEVTANMTLVEESLTAEFVQDLSMTLQPVKVAHTLPS
ncbi:uncharacterized protein ACWYII_026226 isoform 1-T1 [Salvelinus alpinus]